MNSILVIRCSGVLVRHSKQTVGHIEQCLEAVCRGEHLVQGGVDLSDEEIRVDVAIDMTCTGCSLCVLSFGYTDQVSLGSSCS